MNISENYKKGSALVFSIIFAAVAGITVLAIARSIDFNARQSNYFERMGAAYKLGETGINDAITRLVRNPSIVAFSSAPRTDPNNRGIYSTIVATRTFSVNGGTPQKMYYLITSATTSGTAYSTRIHAYVKVSNVGDYFWAVKERAWPSGGINASGGKLYAPDITFTIGGAQSRFACAEYVNSVTPAENPNWNLMYGASVDISTDCNIDKSPKKVDPLVFPQVFETDLMNWKDKATSHTKVNKFGADFIGLTNVYPPGFNTGAIPGYIINDNYGANRTTNNADHIYYSTGDIVLTNVCVVGQVLFISSGNIYINGDLITATAGTFPGTGPGASEAHQAVLIAGGAVIISSYTKQFNPFIWPNYMQGDPPPLGFAGPRRLQRIQALILTPNGRLIAQHYGVDSSGFNPTPTARAYQEALALDFKGSLIAAGAAGAPNTLPNIFGGIAGQRTYAYDPTFSTHPPPYLPSISEIHYMFEEKTNLKALFN